jgi:hypothetical protein
VSIAATTRTERIGKPEIGHGRMVANRRRSGKRAKAIANARVPRPRDEQV